VPFLKHIPRPFQWLLKLLFTAIALWLLVRKIDFTQLMETVKGASWIWLVLCTVLQLPIAIVNALRWKILHRIPGLPLRKYVYYVFIGNTLSMFLPSAALAEGARAFAFGKRYGGITGNFAAAIFARGCGFLVQLAVLILFVFMFRESLSRLPLWNGLRLDASVGALLLLMAVALAILGGFLAVRFQARLRQVVAVFAGYMRSPGTVAWILLLSVVMQGLLAVSTYTLFKTVGWELTWWHAVVVPPLIQMLLLLPVSFGGVGVREYLALVLYGQLAGVPSEKTVAASLLAYIPLLVVSAGTGAWMAYRKAKAG